MVKMYKVMLQEAMYKQKVIVQFTVEDNGLLLPEDGGNLSYTTYHIYNEEQAKVLENIFKYASGYVTEDPKVINILFEVINNPVYDWCLELPTSVYTDPLIEI